MLHIDNTIRQVISKMNKQRPLFSWALSLLLLAFPMISHAHVHMNKSQPAKGEVLATAPTVVQLWFSGEVSAEWSRIEVTSDKGERVDSGTVSNIGSDTKSLQIKLKPIGSGSYEIKWNAVSNDGHRIKGSSPFSVKQ